MAGGLERESDATGVPLGTPVREAPADHPEIHIIHLRQVLGALQVGALAFVVFCGAMFALLRDPAIGLTGALILAFLAVAVVAKKQLGRGNRQTAVVSLCTAILGASLALVPLQPGLLPTSAVTTLVATALALLYANQRALKFLMSAAWLSAVAMVLAGPLLLSLTSGQDASPFDLTFGTFSLAAAAAIALLLLWQFRARLMGALEQAHRAEAQARYDATHDPLTGLPNRTLLEALLSRRLSGTAAGASPSDPFAVLFLDLDRFKHVNDSLGHPIGDELLKVVAMRLSTCVRPEEGDTVARLSGDEFVIVLQGAAGVGVAEEVAERIQGALKRPVKLHGHELYATASIGILPDCSGYETPEEVLRDADTAMFRAKEAGKARPAVFEPSMRARAISLLRLETDLRRAVERGEFAVRYQPVVWLATGGVAGFEASARWAHPERGLLSPEQFLPLAEETGLAQDIERFVLREACRSAALWRRRFPDRFPPSVSVDLSTGFLYRPNLPDEVALALAEAGLPASALTIALPEGAIAENPESAVATLERLAALGVRLAVGGFGTGRSSLRLLHRLPVGALKIDRAFVNGAGAGDEDPAEVVRTILAVAHGLGMEVIAEGVENPEQAHSLSEMECDYALGPRFSRPVDADGAVAILAAEPVW